MRNGTAGGTGAGHLRRICGVRNVQGPGAQLPAAADRGWSGGAAARAVRGPQAAVQLTLEPGALQALDQAGEAFIAAQLERGFRTLDYYKALLG